MSSVHQGAVWCFDSQDSGVCSEWCSTDKELPPPEHVVENSENLVRTFLPMFLPAKAKQCSSLAYPEYCILTLWSVSCDKLHVENKRMNVEWSVNQHKVLCTHCSVMCEDA